MKITTQTAINTLGEGSVVKLAKRLTISRQAVHRWGEFVPKGRAYEISFLIEQDKKEKEENHYDTSEAAW